VAPETAKVYTGAAAARLAERPEPEIHAARLLISKRALLLNFMSKAAGQCRLFWFSPGEKHWHGASPSIAMTHIAVQESLDGKAVEWMEHVTDEQYGPRAGHENSPECRGQVADGRPRR
jgi:hypothetical protein